MDSSNSHEIIEGGAGVMVLLVDKDMDSLMDMSSILEDHSYKVTPTNSVFAALSMILERKSKFDLIISEIDMPGMDGFELLEQITSKVDIPTILISTNDEAEVTRKALAEGACFFYRKPIAPRTLVDMWLHCYAFRVKQNQLEKAKSSLLGNMPFSSSSLGMGNHTGERPSSDSVHGNPKEKKKDRAPPLSWTPELKQKFLEIYECLGETRATPSKIKELMTEPGVTVHHISSYLQRFRARLKAQNRDETTQPGMPPHLNNLDVRSPRCLSTPLGNLVLRSLPMYHNNQFSPVQRNIGPALRPLAPNMVNFQGNIGAGNFVPGPRPQIPPAPHGGLGMVGDNFGRNGGNQRYANYQNGSLGMRGGSINMAQIMDAEEMENILHQSPDDDIGNDASSPSCSVNQPSMPPHSDNNWSGESY